MEKLLREAAGLWSARFAQQSPGRVNCAGRPPRSTNFHLLILRLRT